jgi:hypothetical protein
MDRFTNDATFFYNTARILYGREEGVEEHCTMSSENEDGHAASRQGRTRELQVTRAK